jgi:hypothetical protein
VSLLRRGTILLTAALFLTLAGLNFSHLPLLLAGDEPRRTVRLTMATAALIAGLWSLYLFVRDLRGRGLPLAACLRPAWLVIGLSLVDAFLASGRWSFLFVGLTATAMGLLSTFFLLRQLRMRRTE